MRKSTLASAIFRPTVPEVLAATALHPEREWFMADLAEHLGVRASSLQRSLASLVDAGVLRRRRDGNRVYYRADPDCPILDELAAILVKTIGIAEPIRTALTPLAGKIIAAFVHGSIAAGGERSESDVDVMIVGDAAGVAIAKALRPVREKLGREINVNRYTASEFSAKRAAQDSFLSVVMAKPKLYVLGSDAKLDRLGKGEKASRPGDDKGRDR